MLVVQFKNVAGLPDPVGLFGVFDGNGSANPCTGQQKLTYHNAYLTIYSQAEHALKVLSRMRVHIHIHTQTAYWRLSFCKMGVRCSCLGLCHGCACTGHGGPNAADFVRNNLFDSLLRNPKFPKDIQTALGELQAIQP